MKVKTISKQGQAALIEWTGDDWLIHRSIVPLASIDNGRIDPAELEYAIHDDGIDLIGAMEYDLMISVYDLQNALRKAGIWTKEDYLSKPNVILGVLQKLYGADVATLQNIAVGVE